MPYRYRVTYVIKGLPCDSFKRVRDIRDFIELDRFVLWLEEIGAKYDIEDRSLRQTRSIPAGSSEWMEWREMVSREVRMVPADWQHPKQKPSHENGWRDDRLQPMFDKCFDEVFSEWLNEFDRIRSGNLTDFEKECYPRGLADWLNDDGALPDPEYYMPAFAEGEATHMMMYETTSEGTPISPAFKTPEDLARWLVDNNASAFGGMTASYEDWLSMINREWAPSAVMVADGILESGVAGFTKL